ncbi:hypothetical protein [Alteribacter natronophilus]|uniref:hypothetical protein n=1 Tax=Alteribacter natronophilus TaxID=2583810 RepID=UPI00110E2FFB|nr:hypothetical protein [Alteribacter natronophilus]TMW70708.1 hypothetical protein FGB90_16130 [Alteribacter natronophilus]
MPVSVIFNQINVNSIGPNSSVTTGQNNQVDWALEGKVIIAGGIQVGAVFNTNVINNAIDCDGIDQAWYQPEIANPIPNFQF